MNNLKRKDFDSGGYYINIPKGELKDGTGNCPISHARYYRGVPNLKRLNERITTVVKANPWLCGEYRRNPETKKFPCLWVPEEPNPSNILEVIENSNINYGISYQELEEKLEAKLVNNGKVGRPKAPKPLFKVIVVKGKGNTFCVIVSLCHTLGDGFTYSKIFKMLSFDANLEALDANRIDVRKELKHKLGEERINWFMSPYGLFPFLFRMFFNNNKTIYRCFDKTWIDRQKAKHIPSEQVPWISSNDVVSSFLMKELKMDACLMALNPRNRFSMYGNNKAGNYVVPLIFRNNEFTPSTIRMKVEEKKPSTWRSIPGIFESLKMNTGVITNLSVWDYNLSIEGCEELFNIPILKPPTATLAIIWKPKKDMIAVSIKANSKIQKAIDHHAAIIKFNLD